MSWKGGQDSGSPACFKVLNGNAKIFRKNSTTNKFYIKLLHCAWAMVTE